MRPRADTFLALALSMANACAGCGAAPPPCALATDCPAPLACDRGNCTDPTTPPRPDEIALRRHRLWAVADTFVVRGGEGDGAAVARPAHTADFLLVGGSAESAAWRSYLRFDLTPLGDGAHVVRADLVLAARDDPPGLPSGRVWVYVHRAARAWNEAGLGWRGQPGGAGGEQAVANVPGARRLPVRVELTPLVRDWLRGAHPNHGIVLSARDEDADRRVVFYSGSSPDEDARPTLDVWVR